MPFGAFLANARTRRYITALDYFGAKTWPGTFGKRTILTDRLENQPRSQWPVRNGHDEHKVIGDVASTDKRSPSHWAELTNRW